MEFLNETPGRILLVIGIAALIFSFAAESPITAQVSERPKTTESVDEVLGFPWQRHAGEMEVYTDDAPEFSGAALAPPEVPSVPEAKAIPAPAPKAEPKPKPKPKAEANPAPKAASQGVVPSPVEKPPAIQKSPVQKPAATPQAQDRQPPAVQHYYTPQSNCSGGICSPGFRPFGGFFRR